MEKPSNSFESDHPSFDQKKESLAYQSFIRQKYLKYSHKVRKIPEQLFFHKVSKQWSNLSPKEKQDLYQFYLKQKFISLNEDEEEEGGIINVKKSKENAQEKTKILKEKENQAEERRNCVISLSEKRKKKEKTEVQPATIINLEEEEDQSPILMLGEKFLENVQKHYDNPQNSTHYKHLLSFIRQNSLRNNNNNQSIKLQADIQALIKREQEQEKDYYQDHSLSISLQVHPSRKVSSHFRSKKQQKTQGHKEEKQKKTSAYLEYFQNGYKLLRESCPYLSVIEITKLLSAIWKKEQLTNKIKQIQLRNQKRERQKIQTLKIQRGRELFKKHKKEKGYSDIEIFTIWASLPMESKMLWAQSKNQNLLVVLQPQKQNEIKNSIIYRSNPANTDDDGRSDVEMQGSKIIEDEAVDAESRQMIENERQ